MKHTLYFLFLFIAVQITYSAQPYNENLKTLITEKAQKLKLVKGNYVGFIYLCDDSIDDLSFVQIIDGRNVVSVSNLKGSLNLSLEKRTDNINGIISIIRPDGKNVVLSTSLKIENDFECISTQSSEELIADKVKSSEFLLFYISI